MSSPRGTGEAMNEVRQDLNSGAAAKRNSVQQRRPTATQRKLRALELEAEENARQAIVRTEAIKSILQGLNVMKAAQEMSKARGIPRRERLRLRLVIVRKAFSRSQRFQRSLRVVGWRLILFYRCQKRVRSTRMVRLFFRDFSKNHVMFLMLRFRWNAIKLQRYVRSYMRCTKSRLFSLAILWERTVLEVKDKVQRDVQTQLAEIATDVTEEAVWRDVRLQHKELPRLSIQVNRATNAAIDLQDTVAHGASMLDALPVLIGRTESVSRSSAKAKNKQGDPGQWWKIDDSKRNRLLKAYLQDRRHVHMNDATVMLKSIRLQGRTLSMEDVREIVTSKDYEEEGAMKLMYHFRDAGHPPLLLFTGPGSEGFVTLVEDTLREHLSDNVRTQARSLHRQASAVASSPLPSSPSTRRLPRRTSNLSQSSLSPTSLPSVRKTL